jgi:E3 ubiquitin ligase
MLPTLATFALLAAVSSHDRGKIVVYSAIGACVGLYLFFRGFKMLQFKRLIQNTPASKVRSASMGLVELNGMPVGPNTIPAGITGDPCFYYRATAWERVQSGRNTEWKRVADESLFVPFFLQDDTGRMLVNAQGADMDVHCNFKDEFGSSFFGSSVVPTGSVEDFLLRYGLSGKHVRLQECCIQPEYPLFVLGTLCENHARWDDTPEKHISGASSSFNLSLNSGSSGGGLLQMFGGVRANARMQIGATTVPAGQSVNISQRAVKAASPQTSSWNSISMDEVHPLLSTKDAVATEELTAEMSPASSAERQFAPQRTSYPAATSLPDMPPLSMTADPAFDLNVPCAISKGEAGAPFTISCESQRELVRALGWKSAACIWGGPALTVICVYILLVTLGVM